MKRRLHVLVNYYIEGEMGACGPTRATEVTVELPEGEDWPKHVGLTLVEIAQKHFQYEKEK